MTWLDIKLLATIGASGVAGFVATSALVHHSAFDETLIPEPMALVHVHSEAPNPRPASFPSWWKGEAPIRFSGPGARGMGKMERSRRRSGFQLKAPPRRLGSPMNSNGTRIRWSEMRTPGTAVEYELQIRPPVRR